VGAEGNRPAGPSFGLIKVLPSPFYSPIAVEKPQDSGQLDRASVVSVFDDGLSRHHSAPDYIVRETDGPVAAKLDGVCSKLVELYCASA
jgi:hypothetical protein